MLFGKSIFDLMKDKSAKDFADAGNPVFDGEMAEHDDQDHGFSIELKKKRRTQMLRQMLNDEGYGDLAKMVKIKEY